MFYNNQEPRTAFQLGFESALLLSRSAGSATSGSLPRPSSAGIPSVNQDDAEFPLLITVDENLKSPYYEQWNLAVQHSLPWDMAVEVGYVGTRGLHLQVLRDRNQPTPAPETSRRGVPIRNTATSPRSRTRADRYTTASSSELTKRLGSGLWFLASFARTASPRVIRARSASTRRGRRTA